MSGYTDNPSPGALELRRREQNLKLINYCPVCDDWMTQSNGVPSGGKFDFTCTCGFKRVGNPAEFIK